MSEGLNDTVDPRLAVALKEGRSVWLKRHWRNVVPAFASSIAAVFAVAMAATDPGNLPPILLVVFLMAAAALLWWRVLASRLQFTETAVMATDQNLGLFRHHILLCDLVAACIIGIGLNLHIRGVANSHFCVYVCELTPGRGNPSRWVALWITPYAVNASTLLAELRHRCELSEISPMSRDYSTAVWPQPTVWQRPGLDPNLLPQRWRK